MEEKPLSPEQCLILELLRQRWSEKPELRFGELIGELVYLADGHTDTAFLEDKHFIESTQKGWRSL